MKHQDIYEDLAKIINLTGRIALEIRSLSRSCYNDGRMEVIFMWSYSIHNLEWMGEAILKGDLAQIEESARLIAGTFKENVEIQKHYFGHFHNIVSLNNDAIKIFSDLELKVKQLQIRGSGDEN